MVEIRIDTSLLDEMRRSFSAGSAKAMERAVKGEAFRLRTIAQRTLSAGVGPAAAPLTQAEQKTRTPQALSALSRFVAYEVSRAGPAGVEAKIGFSRSVTRARNQEGRKRQLVALFGGDSRPITREDQARIARKVRKRLGEPVGRRRRKTRSRNVGRQWADIRVLIPRVGTVVTWPERDWVAQVVARESRNSAANIRDLYAMALRGERWASGKGKQWWGETGRLGR